MMTLTLPLQQGSRPEDLLILVDFRNRALRPLGKLAVHEQGLLHRAFSIFLVDGDGRLLLQRRHPSKYHSGGLWANTCCGHPRWGEPTVTAARRRLAEEMGTTSELQLAFHTRYRTEFENGLSENEAVAVYFGRFEGTLRVDPYEVAEVAFMDVDRLREQALARPDDYAFWLRYYLSRHLPEIQRGLARF
jgi:isopentenyl-diphosphate Delta-isomerase